MRKKFFKRFTALTLAGALVLSSAAVTNLSVDVFADSTNKISNNIRVARKTLLCEPGIELPKLNSDQTKVKRVLSGSYLNIKLDDYLDGSAHPKFNLTLTNAKFAFGDYERYVDGVPFNEETGSVVGNVYTRRSEHVKRDAVGSPILDEDNNFQTEIGNDYELEFDEDYATVTVLRSFWPDETIKIPMVVRMDEDLTSGTATVKVDANNSGISSSSRLTFASVDKGSTTASVKNIQTGKNRIYIKELLIQENVVGSMNPAEGEGFYLELPSGYRFVRDDFRISATNMTFNDPDVELTSNERRLEVRFDDSFEPSISSTGRIKITGLSIVPKNDNENTQKDEIMIDIGNIGSSNMVTNESFKAGIRADYGISFKIDDTVPTILNGFYDSNSYSNEKVRSAKLVVSEETVGSLINGGDLKLTVSDKAKIRAVRIEDKDNIKEAINGTHPLEKSNNNSNTSGVVEVKEDKVILRGLHNSSDSTDSGSKAKFTVSFYLSVESGYEGDITVKASGDALRNNSTTDEQAIVIAKAVSPVTVDVKTSYFTPGTTVNIDDIVLTEQKVGKRNYSSFEENKTLVFGFKNNNNYLSIVGTPTVSVENGSVKDVKVNNSSRDGSVLSFKIKETSSGTKLGKITISGLKVSSSLSTPLGIYPFVVGGTAIAGNSTALIGTDSNKASFSTDGIAVAKLQYGGATSMKITIGDKIAVINGKNVEMQFAPFIDPATGTTYMQVSDIVKATGMNCSFFDNAIHKIDGMNKNLFVTFGSRTFERNSSSVRIYGETIPETMTNEQGMPVNMIIKNDYTCLPLRYFVEKVLGQKITWNGTDNTIVVE